MAMSITRIYVSRPGEMRCWVGLAAAFLISVGAPVAVGLGGPPRSVISAARAGELATAWRGGSTLWLLSITGSYKYIILNRTANLCF